MKFLSQFIWYNSEIKLRNNVLIWRNWIRKGIWCINDIVNSNGKLKSHEECDVNWLDLQTVWNCIPEYFKFLLSEQDDRTAEICLFDKLNKMKSGTRGRKIYDMLINDTTLLGKYWNRWIERGLPVEWDSYLKCFRTIFYATPISKFRDFQLQTEFSA